MSAQFSWLGEPLPFALSEIPTDRVVWINHLHPHDIDRAVAAAPPDAPAVIVHQADGSWNQGVVVTSILDRMEAAVGRRGVRVPVPPAVVRVAARVSQAAARVRGRPAIFDQDKAIELLADGWLCDTERARLELGFEARIPLDEGLRETAGWYRAGGWL
jgi:nucleoside-diphosphate-sugar epimerase